jgi:hypothetical protein
LGLSGNKLFGREGGRSEAPTRMVPMESLKTHKVKEECGLEDLEIILVFPCNYFTGVLSKIYYQFLLRRTDEKIIDCFMFFAVRVCHGSVCGG